MIISNVKDFEEWLETPEGEFNARAFVAPLESDQISFREVMNRLKDIYLGTSFAKFRQEENEKKKKFAFAKLLGKAA